MFKNNHLYEYIFLNMIWHFLRHLMTFVQPTFYKRIQAKNDHYLQEIKGPVILAMNHPNAFADPACFAMISYPVRTYYVARGDAFKPGLIAAILENMGIIPIFRIQDGGKEGLKKNNETYQRVNALLKQKKAKVMVYAEGLCIQERRLRPLKKGVARMVFGAQEHLGNEELTIIPIGLNYSAPSKFRSTLFYNFGEPFKLEAFKSLYEENPAKAHNAFIQALEPKMKALIMHINDKQFDDVVSYIEQLFKKDSLKAQGLNYKHLEDDYTVSKQIVTLVNSISEKEPERLKTFQEKAGLYLKTVKANGLRDWLLNPLQNKSVTAFYLNLRLVLMILGFPLHVLSLLTNYGPYKFTERLTKKVAKTIEFYSSMAIGIGTFVFLLYYLLVLLISWLILPNIGWALLTIILFLLLGWYGLHFHFFKLKTLGMWRYLKHYTKYEELRKTRSELMNELQALRTQYSRF